MADGPLELSLQPLLPESKLICLRLDMPLGMLLEESPLNGCAADGSDEADAADADDAANADAADADADAADELNVAVVAEMFDVGSALGGGVELGTHDKDGPPDPHLTRIRPATE